jgi:hypothetical protein
MSENLGDLAVRPTYEEIVQSIKHQGVRESLRHAQENERRLGRELERIEDDQDLLISAQTSKPRILAV